MKSFIFKSNYLAQTSVFLISLLLLIWMAPSPALSGKLTAELIKIDTRPKVTQKFVLIKPDKSVAAVILLEGGYGRLKISSAFGKPAITYDKFFLTRSREDFAKQGFTVVLPDVPSDKKKIYPSFRLGIEHAQDVEAVVSFLKNEGNIAVWLVGMGTGTFSALNAANRFGELIDGIVLLSSITVSNDEWQIYDSHPNGILDMDLKIIKQPTLVVSHKESKCKASPPSDVPKIKAAIDNSRKIEVMTFTGGREPRGVFRSTAPIPPECQPRSPHHFYGIEEKVVAAIGDFIKNNSK